MRPARPFCGASTAPTPRRPAHPPPRTPPAATSAGPRSRRTSGANPAWRRSSSPARPIIPALDDVGATTRRAVRSAHPMPDVFLAVLGDMRRSSPDPTPLPPRPSGVVCRPRVARARRPPAPAPHQRRRGVRRWMSVGRATGCGTCTGREPDDCAAPDPCRPNPRPMNPAPTGTVRLMRASGRWRVACGRPGGATSWWARPGRGPWPRTAAAPRPSGPAGRRPRGWPCTSV